MSEPELQLGRQGRSQSKEDVGVNLELDVAEV